MKSNRVGILGGGQLALMLAMAAQRMGFRPIILAEGSNCSAVQIFGDAVLGSMDNEQVLDCFFSQVDLVIFENEFVDCEKIKKAAIRGKNSFSPSLDAISIFQDKLRQKEILQGLKIPTAEYLVLDLDKTIRPQILSALERFGGSCVLKWSRLGYDGKGVLVIDDPKDIRLAEEFCNLARIKSSLVYVEKKIDFRRELAMIAVYSVKGEFLSYPLVVSEQTQGVCSRVYGPATSLGIPYEKEVLAQNYARKIAEGQNLTGAFGIELFETQDGEVIVNEIAPRVHNSGHYTQDACGTDQFENHWRAVLGMKLGETLPRSCFAMLNILGPLASTPSSQGIPVPGPRSHLTWYHKEGIRPGRKLGHLNGVEDSIEKLDDLLLELTDVREKWVEKLLSERKK